MQQKYIDKIKPMNYCVRRIILSDLGEKTTLNPNDALTGRYHKNMIFKHNLAMECNKFVTLELTLD